MKKKITILGCEVIIVFNMAVQITFEEISGKPFAEIDNNSSKDNLALAYSAILANNPDTSITIDKLMHEASGKDMAELLNAVTESFIQWNKMPSTLDDEDDNTSSPDTSFPELEASASSDSPESSAADDSAKNS